MVNAFAGKAFYELKARTCLKGCEGEQYCTENSGTIHDDIEKQDLVPAVGTYP